MNIVDILFKTADRSAPALIANGVTLSYGGLLERLEKVSDQLRRAGICEVEGIPRIGLSCPNGLEYVIFALAILRAGGCLVPIASELSSEERDALVLSTGLHSVLIPAGGEWNHSLPGWSSEICVSGVNSISEFTDFEKQDARNGIPTNNSSGIFTAPPFFKATLLNRLRGPEAGALVFNEPQLSAINPAFIRFSSGTTGKSKGVVLSHQTLLDRITAANRVLKIGPTDRVVWILPMAHHFAVSIMLYLLNGAVTVIENSHFPGDILSAARFNGGTVLYGAPFHHALLASEDSGLSWPGLRLAVSTAATLPLATAMAFENRFGVPLSQALGMIEVGLPFLNVDAPHEKPESVGRPLPDFLLSIRDENGTPCEVGKVGELLVRGPGMLDAYLSPWRVRNEILEEGWFRTGDLAMIDSEGFVQISGRAHSVINVAGMKCFPEEIEAVLCSHPSIQSARVYAKAHAKFGSVPAVDLVALDPENPPAVIELVSYCRKALASFKIPVEYNFIETLPLTPSGKIVRR